MSEYEMIGIVQKNQFSDIRVRFAEYHGKRYLDVRTFVTADATGERVPTRKGITLAPDKLPELLALLKQAIAFEHATNRRERQSLGEAENAAG